jgi:acetyl esterase/lipase
MPSKQSEAVRRHWQTAQRAMAGELAPEDRPDDESWGNLTAEPRAVDCLHGGGFVGGSVWTHRKMFAHLAKAAGARALVVSYRLLPDGVYPAPADDVLAAYQWLLDEGTAAGDVAFAGDSAGGWLALAVQLRARDRGLPLPAATLLLSPWADLEASGRSYDGNRGRDPFFTREVVTGLARGFLGGASPRDPLAGPLHADLTGLGPVCIQAGGDEALLDDARGLEQRLTQAGVEVRLDVYPGMLHTFQMAAGRAPEADAAIGQLAGWVRPRLGR